MSRPHQEWEVVTLEKNKKRQPTKQETATALRRGDVQTHEKFMAGQNKQTRPPANAAKIDEDTGDYHVDRVTLQFSKALQRARVNAKLTQAQLAAAVNEKPTVIQDYESEKAVPSGDVVQKLNRVLKTTLPPSKKKQKPRPDEGP
eukprot:Polyplicarium_translucidae@DN242_c0_g1_i1.p3